MPLYPNPLYAISVVAVGSPVGRLPALTPPNMHMTCTIFQHASFAELSISPIGVARVGLRLGAVAVAVALWVTGDCSVGLPCLRSTRENGHWHGMDGQWHGMDGQLGMVTSSRCRLVRGTKLHTEYAAAWRGAVRCGVSSLSVPRRVPTTDRFATRDAGGIGITIAEQSEE